MPLLALNVFCEDNVKFGSVVRAEGPALDFTDGGNFGLGSLTARADGSHFAPTQLKAKVISMGSADLDLTLSVKNWQNDVVSIDVTIPGDSSSGSFINIGTSSDKYLDLIGCTFKTSGVPGTVGDSIEFYNLKERTVQL
jgi:hypothetical protein